MSPVSSATTHGAGSWSLNPEAGVVDIKASTACILFAGLGTVSVSDFWPTRRDGTEEASSESSATYSGALRCVVAVLLIVAHANGHPCATVQHNASYGVG